MRPHSALLALALIAALLVAGCGGSDDNKKNDTTKPKPAAQAATQATTTAAKAGCQNVAAPSPKSSKASKPTQKLDPSKTYTATVDTSCGSFDIVLDVKNDPKTSASFASLADQKFYDDTTFHRVVKGFVIQGGDPQLTGQGGPSYSVVEAPPKDTQYSPGVVAMAKTEVEAPGTSGSQFFVVAGPGVQLPPDYAVLGKVSSGMDVVSTINAVPTGPNDMPVSPVVINSITVKES